MTGNRERPGSADSFAPYIGARVVVLGASGFIGRWVARALTRRGARLFLPVREPVAARAIFAQFGVEGDIIQADLGTDPETLGRLYTGIEPAVTFNLAGYGVDRSERDEGLAYRINEQLVRSICKAMSVSRDKEWQGQSIVHVGSALEYGEIGGDLSEDSAVNPTTLYGQSKLAGTRALAACCKQLGLKGMTARLFTVYGPGEHEGRLLPSLLQTANSGEALDLTAGMQKRDFTFVEDVAEGLLRFGLASPLYGDVINLASGRLTTVREFTETAAGVLSIPAGLLKFGAVPTRSEEMEHLPVAIKRMRQTLNWAPMTDARKGIRRTADFFSKGVN